MEMLKPPAETLYETELRALREEDTGKRPQIGCCRQSMSEILLLGGINLQSWTEKRFPLHENIMATMY